MAPKKTTKTEKPKRSVAPFYAFGITWLLYGIFFSLHQPADYVLAALLSAAIFTIFYLATLPKKTEAPQTAAPQTPPAEEEAPLTDAEKKLAECELYLDAVRKIRAQTASAQWEIADELEKLEKSLENVVKELQSHPEDLPKMHKFLNYYMPTTLKLMKTYVEVYDREGENFERITTETEGIIHTMAIALDKQLDKLYEDDAMDISADASVLQQMLKREGLMEDELKQAGAHPGVSGETT